jgi:hypothetical protein
MHLGKQVVCFVPTPRSTPRQSQATVTLIACLNGLGAQAPVEDVLAQLSSFLLTAKRSCSPGALVGGTSIPQLQQAGRTRASMYV